MAQTFQPILLSSWIGTLSYFRHPQSDYVLRNGITTTSEAHNHFFFYAHSRCLHQTLVCLVDEKIIGIFIHESRSRNCYISLVSCHISTIFILIAFKPPKGTAAMVDLSKNQFSTHSMKQFTL